MNLRVFYLTRRGISDGYADSPNADNLQKRFFQHYAPSM